MSDWTEADVQKILRVRGADRQAPTVDLPQKKKSKYHATKTLRDGIVFDSHCEADRYSALKLLEQAGEITDLVLQPAFQLFAHTLTGGYVYVGTYTADFEYRQGGAIIREDVKSPPTRTEAYRLRRKLAQACHGITIREV